MCSVIDNEIKHINKSLATLVVGQEQNNEDHKVILQHIAVSNERWTEQKKINTKLEKAELRNKIWNGSNSVLAAIAGFLGFA